MKTVSIKFYHISEEPKPEILDEIIIVGKSEYDVITFNGEFLPAWVDHWGKLDFDGL